MTIIDCNAYPRFRATLTPTELHDHFTPTAKELALAEASTRDDAAKLTFLVLYKCLGYLLREEGIPLKLPRTCAGISTWMSMLRSLFPLALAVATARSFARHSR